MDTIRKKETIPKRLLIRGMLLFIFLASLFAYNDVRVERDKYKGLLKSFEKGKAVRNRLSVLYWDGSNLLKDILDEQQPLPTKKVKAKAKAWEKNIEIYLRKHFDEFYVTRFYTITGKKIVVPARFSSLKHRNLYATVQARMENLFEILLDISPRKPVFDREGS